MYIASVRGRISKDAAGAVAWSKQIAKFVQEKTAVAVEVLVHVGGTQDVVFLSRHESLAAYEKVLEQIHSDPGYWAQVKEAEARGFFDGPTVENGIWRIA